jgi:acetyltransferase-like isoleucine patch superfamily enzyme
VRVEGNSAHTPGFRSVRSRVDPATFLADTAAVYGPTTIELGVVVEDYCVLGKPDMYALARLSQALTSGSLTDYDAFISRVTSIGAGCILGTGTHIYEGSVLDVGVETEDFVRIGWDSRVGPRTRIMYRAQVYCNVTIGADCRIAGYIANDTTIGDRVSFFGTTAHDYQYRTSSHEYRPSPTIGDDAIVAVGAVIVGGVRVGERSYVTANAVVTRDVPPDAVVAGANRLIPKSALNGRPERLSE